MARKDIKPSAQTRLDEFNKDHPDWIKAAREALITWGDTEYLITAVAKALKAHYEAGLQGKSLLPPPAPTRITRKPPQVTESRKRLVRKR